jgi:hypothetical protein
MTPPQSSLFDAPIAAGSARKSDPWSSREAAKNTKPAPAKQQILAAFMANGGTGTLDVACAALPHLLRNVLSRRISDLAAEGKLIPTGRHVDGAYGQPIAVWRVL